MTAPLLPRHARPQLMREILIGRSIFGFIQQLTLWEQMEAYTSALIFLQRLEPTTIRGLVTHS